MTISTIEPNDTFSIMKGTIESICVNEKDNTVSMLVTSPRDNFYFTFVALKIKRERII
jgi:hypothetical protein